MSIKVTECLASGDVLLFWKISHHYFNCHVESLFSLYRLIAEQQLLRSIRSPKCGSTTPWREYYFHGSKWPEPLCDTVSPGEWLASLIGASSFDPAVHFVRESAML